MIFTRKKTNRLLELIEDGYLDKDTVILACLKYMSEDDVADMARINDFIAEYSTDDFEYEIEVHPEDASIEGNALDSGDPEEDERYYQMIREQLAAGNEYAWCSIRVVCRYEGYETDDWLGCCSYASEEDFKAGGYYEDMIDSAKQAMIEILEG